MLLMREVYLVTILLTQEKFSLKFETSEKLISSKSFLLLTLELVHRNLHKSNKSKTMMTAFRYPLFFPLSYWMKL